MSKTSTEQGKKTPGSPERTEGGLDYQDGKAGTRQDVTDPQKEPEDFDPHERSRGAPKRSGD